jgi:dienelactone hydrolase
MAALLLLCCGLGLAQAPPAGTPNPGAEGRRYLDMLLAGKYAELYQAFTPVMQQSVSEDTLRTKVGPTLQNFGKVQSIGDPKVQLVGGSKLILIPIQFEKEAINFRITIDTDGKVAGLFFQPAAQAATKYERPSYSNPASFEERAVTFGLPDWQLPGTLTVPKGAGSFPAVVLVHGSGPNDRDETIGPNKPFRDLAEGLASKGVAVLRYEKRTRQYAAKAAADKDITVKEEVVDDAVAAADFLTQQPGIDPKRVFLLGHSLGGYLAPRIASEDPKLAGVIIMAGTARPLDEVIFDQLNYLASLPGQPPEAKTQVEKMKTQVDELKKPDAPKDLVVLGLRPHYLQALAGYDPAAVAAKLTMPILVMQGGRDYQATMESDYRIWGKALEGHKNVTMAAFPSLDHLFRTGEGKAKPVDYMQKEGHVAPDVIDTIAKWVAAH